MAERDHGMKRYVAVIAATCIALACGTNYGYSAWAPQFAERMKLSATQSNLIGVAGNMGMYATGIPVGWLVDSRGPRPAVFLGALLLGIGYFPIRKAYDDGPGSMSVGALFFFSFLTGTGSCSAFSAALKTSALNWPQHRGTATALPLSGFGLSALFFTWLAHLFFPNDTSGLLLFLGLGTFLMIFIAMFFLFVPSAQGLYSALPTTEDRPATHRTKSSQSKANASSSKFSGSSFELEQEDENGHALPSEADETSSLMSVPGDIAPDEDATNTEAQHLHRPEKTGLALLKDFEFWMLFATMGLLAGVGLMTINNIGNDVRALWYYRDENVGAEFLHQRQLVQVSIISFGSFAGRLASGAGSDLLVKRLHMSRFWCLVASASVFAVAQICAMSIPNPNWLWVVSILTGLGYGALFGVMPALVADAFGVSGMSLNWGYMILAPVVSGNIYNLCYGRIYDSRSAKSVQGHRQCFDGLACYRRAYVVTFASSVVGIVVALWSIRHERVMRRKLEEEEHRVE